MIAKRTELAGTNDRPFNNLLRRLNAADYELISSHLAMVEAEAGELLGPQVAGDAVGAQEEAVPGVKVHTACVDAVVDANAAVVAQSP